jgi:hypothetical protein
MNASDQEFYQIQRFVAACRRQWPDAKIVLWPNQDDASTGAYAPIIPNTHPRTTTMSNENFTDDLNTPTEADLDSCYGSKYLSATDLGDRSWRPKNSNQDRKSVQGSLAATKRNGTAKIRAVLFDC